MIHKVAILLRDLQHCTRLSFDRNSHFNDLSRIQHFYPGDFSVRASPISNQIQKLVPHAWRSICRIDLIESLFSYMDAALRCCEIGCTVRYALVPALCQVRTRRMQNTMCQCRGQLLPKPLNAGDTCTQLLHLLQRCDYGGAASQDGENTIWSCGCAHSAFQTVVFFY